MHLISIAVLIRQVTVYDLEYVCFTTKVFTMQPFYDVEIH